MIMMIGTGHIFDIAEQVSFIIKNVWPDAVLVELDEKRYFALTQSSKSDEIPKDLPKLYRESAKYQNRMSEENGVQTGGELLAAINTGKLVGAEIVCIDKDAEVTMKEIEDEMSFTERRKYSLSSITDNLFGKRKVNATQKNFATDEEQYIANMRKRYPTLVRKLIDERNTFMADKIRASSEKYDKVIVVVGDAHVSGLADLLSDVPIEIIRLAELMDRERMDAIRSKVWNGTMEGTK